MLGRPVRPVTTTVAVAGIVTLLGALTLGAAQDDFERWHDGSVHGPWLSVFDGHGRNGARGDMIVMRPRTARTPGHTHAGMVVSVAWHENVDFRLELRTVRRLRVPRPNPWEVAWAVWGYTDTEHFYYFIPKPNGWELGKRDPAYEGGQRFLATGGPAFPVGRSYTVRVSQRGATVRVWVNGRSLVTHTDLERPYPRGAVGFYTEDAQVEFRPLGVGSGPAGQASALAGSTEADSTEAPAGRPGSAKRSQWPAALAASAGPAGPAGSAPQVPERPP